MVKLVRSGGRGWRAAFIDSYYHELLSALPHQTHQAKLMWHELRAKCYQYACNGTIPQNTAKAMAAMDASESIRYRDSRHVSNVGNPDVGVTSTYIRSDGWLNLEQHWHPLGMAVSCFLAAVFSITWLFPPGRGYWNQLDLAVFRRLNGTLAWGSVWQAIWAIANWRPFDVVVGCVLVALMIAVVYRRFRGKPVHAFVSLLILVAGAVATSELVSEFVDKAMGYQRGSPTHVLENTYRLNTLVEWVECKDTSKWSFPGDHGFVLLMCAFYATYHGSKRAAIMTWMVAVVCALPRMISGAHWMTDIVVGSGTMALVTSAFLFATPLHDYVLSLVPGGGGLAGRLWLGSVSDRFATRSVGRVSELSPALPTSSRPQRTAELTADQ